MKSFRPQTLCQTGERRQHGKSERVAYRNRETWLYPPLKLTTERHLAEASALASTTLAPAGNISTFYPTGVTSVVILFAGNSQLLHSRLQRGSLHPQTRRRAMQTGDHAASFAQHAQDMFPLQIFQCRVLVRTLVF